MSHTQEWSRLNPACYLSSAGEKIVREAELSINGELFYLHWVLKDKNDKFLDHDQYRHDLFARNNIKMDLE